MFFEELTEKNKEVILYMFNQKQLGVQNFWKLQSKEKRKKLV